MVVEDQEDIRSLILQVLSLDGHVVVEANDGLQGLERFREGLFDLVMTDFEMPVMRGDEMLDKIWQLRPEQRAMVVSSHYEKFGARWVPSAIFAPLSTFSDFSGAISTNQPLMVLKGHTQTNTRLVNSDA